ncbi:hypothetical protein [Myxosarcina sp. GI1]|uniref:hypothetical protein n=1 Tax=Myxosarcina sp. GI1 TaxID=1541065 RepID=UPI000A4408BF|nr:hypothetical protein [Myxosarcina sp. GI1]
MNNKSITKNQKTKQKGFITSTNLILFAFATSFFPRILAAVGFPSLINFAHFISVPFALLVAITQTKTNSIKQIAISYKLLTGLFVFLFAMFASALVNQAGAINAIIDYLLLAEPFMLLLAIVCIPISAAKLKFFKKFLLICASINLLLAFIQKPLIDSGKLNAEGFDGTDGAQGVFFVSGAGNYVSATVSLKFGLYYFFSARTTNIWFRFAWLGAAFLQLIISDSKQIIIASGLAFAILALANTKDLGKTLLYVIAVIIGFSVFIWCANNLEAFSAFKNGIDKLQEWGPGGAAREIKTAPFRIATSYYTSLLNWLFGLGPGHTFGRMGGWFLQDYSNLFIPLHGTTHPASYDAWLAYYGNWIALESTLYHPFFGWAGIWGDLGFTGLGSYLYLASIVWRHLCVGELSKFFMLVVFAVGLIFTQMEEPGYMLFTSMLIGLQWQEQNLKT